MKIRVRLRVVEAAENAGKIGAKEVADGLVRAELVDKDALKMMAVSDFFHAGFIYKPMIYDMVKENSSASYRYLKRVRSASMMHTKFLNYENGTQLLRGVSDQVVLVPYHYYYQYILSRQEFLHEELQPDDEYDFYLEVTQDQAGLGDRLMERETIEIGGSIWQVVEVKSLSEQTGRGWNILLTEMDASLFVGVDSKADNALFRLTFNATNRMQTMKGGSMFDAKDIGVISENVSRVDFAGFEPYFMKM